MNLDQAFGLAPHSPAPARRWPPPLPEDVIPELVAAIVRNCRPLRIILFGSRARGDHRSSSDVDLLVVLQEVPDKRALAAGIRDDLANVPVAKDIFVTTPQEIDEERELVGSFLHHAMQDGKVLYESVG
jgi:predicted nucleotidyltransferase